MRCKLLDTIFRELAQLPSSVIGCHYTDRFFLSFCIISDSGRDRTREVLNTGLH
jgi:hypothetical protein